MNFLLIVAGFIFLIVGGNFLLNAAVDMSLRLGVSKVVIGMTVVSFATSAPELVVSIKAAIDGHTDLAISNAIGSNIVNLGLVLGIILLLSSMTIEKSFYKTDWSVMMISSILLYGFVKYDAELQSYEGLILFAFLVIFLIYLLKFQKPSVADKTLELKKTQSIFKTIFLLIIGAIGLWGGSELLITGAVGLAENFGVSQRLIGLSLISFGTSVPELAASVIALLKKERAISLANLLGSNIFNILAVLGITSIITPIKIIDKGILQYDIYWMLGISFLVFLLVFTPKSMRLKWYDGLILLTCYTIFIYLLISA